MKGLLVIPVHNEATTLTTTVPLLYEFLKIHKLQDVWIVHISDNKSTDDTRTVINELQIRYPNLQYSYTPILGRGAAVRKTWLEKEADLYAYLDADLDIDPEVLVRAAEVATAGVDLVIGSKLVSQSIVKRNFLRRIGSQGISRLAKYTFPKLDIKDTQCGFKLITKKALEVTVEKTKEEGWFFDLELLVYARHYNLNIVELPVNVSSGRFVKRKSKVKPIMDFMSFLVAIQRIKTNEKKLD